MSSIVRIDNVMLDDADTVGSLYFVMTGVGRYLQHYAPLKKYPNAILVVDTSAGVNDGLVNLVVRTRNKCGVAPGTPLVINYGMEYDHEGVGAVVGQPDPKRARGLLQMFFDKLGREAAAEAAA